MGLIFMRLIEYHTTNQRWCYDELRRAEYVENSPGCKPDASELCRFNSYRGDYMNWSN